MNDHTYTAETAIQLLLFFAIPFGSWLEVGSWFCGHNLVRWSLSAEDALDQLTHLSGLIMRPVSLAYYQCLG